MWRTQIRLKADQTVTDAFSVSARFAAEIAIDGANSKITLKADKIDLDALITKVNGLTTGGVKAKSLYTEKLIVTNNYVHIGEKGRLVEDIHRRHGFHASVGRNRPLRLTRPFSFRPSARG